MSSDSTEAAQNFQEFKSNFRPTDVPSSTVEEISTLAAVREDIVRLRVQVSRLEESNDRDDGYMIRRLMDETLSFAGSPVDFGDFGAGKSIEPRMMGGTQPRSFSNPVSSWCKQCRCAHDSDYHLRQTVNFPIRGSPPTVGLGEARDPVKLSDECEEGIQKSVTATSRDDPAEDEAIKEALRASLRELQQNSHGGASEDHMTDSALNRLTAQSSKSSVDMPKAGAVESAPLVYEGTKTSSSAETTQSQVSMKRNMNSTSPQVEDPPKISSPARYLGIGRQYYSNLFQTGISKLGHTASAYKATTMRKLGRD